MLRVIQFFRHLKRSLLRLKNPFASYVVLSEDTVGQLDIESVRGSQLTIRCTRRRLVETRQWFDVRLNERNVYIMSATCSQDSPEEVRNMCKLVIHYDQTHPLHVRESDVFEVLCNHYVKSLEFQMPDTEFTSGIRY